MLCISNGSNRASIDIGVVANDEMSFVIIKHPQNLVTAIKYNDRVIDSTMSKMIPSWVECGASSLPKGGSVHIDDDDITILRVN